jgi:hypothetical protein
MMGLMSDQKLPYSRPKTSWKWVFASMGTGMLLLVVGVSALLPQVFSWYFEPPASMGVSCSAAVRWAVERVLGLQVVSLVVGAVGGLALALFWRNRRKSD